jgi:transcriptional regulator with XRE-family HTH domain
MPDEAARVQRQFAAALRAEREARGLTQRQLAVRAKLSLNYVGEIERGRRMITLLTLRRLAAALQLTTTELVVKSGI